MCLCGDQIGIITDRHHISHQQGMFAAKYSSKLQFNWTLFCIKWLTAPSAQPSYKRNGTRHNKKASQDNDKKAGTTIYTYVHKGSNTIGNRI